jgi:hypothetical protein
MHAWLDKLERWHSELENHVGYVCFSESGFRETTFQTFMCLFFIRKVGQRKTLSSQRKIWLSFQESVFLENLGGKHFPEVVKNLEMSYYLLIISNLVLKLLIAIYILFWIFIFQFHPLEFNFYIKAMFVSRKVVSGKPLSKLFYVCLPLEKLVNGKHFPVKGKFSLVSTKVFSWKIWAENTFRKLWKI